jgi:hypothetical protein
VRLWIERHAGEEGPEIRAPRTPYDNLSGGEFDYRAVRVLPGSRSRANLGGVAIQKNGKKTVMAPHARRNSTAQHTKEMDTPFGLSSVGSSALLRLELSAITATSRGVS